jgi:RNA polymerase sigma factor (sigma-70 family)
LDEDFLRRHEALIRAMVRKYSWLYRLNRMSRDELVQAAMIGLWRAYRRFDPGKGVEFGTFAKHHVVGEIIDTLRAYVGRTGKYGRTKTGEDMDIASDGLNASDIERIDVQDMVDGIPFARLRAIMKRRLEGATLKTIGEDIGRTESWAAQLVKKAMVFLRRRR